MDNKLKEVRVSKGLTQAELGELIGLKQNIVSAWEIGRRELPVRHAKKLAQILKVDWKDLYED